jgi:hypothetical protein
MRLEGLGQLKNPVTSSGIVCPPKGINMTVIIRISGVRPEVSCISKFAMHFHFNTDKFDGCRERKVSDVVYYSYIICGIKISV